MSLTTTDLSQIQGIVEDIFEVKLNAKVIPRLESLESEVKALRNDVKDIHDEIALLKA